MPSVCDCCNSYCAREKEEDSGMLMSSVYNCIHIGRKMGKKASAGAGKGSQTRQLTLGKGPAEVGIPSLVQGAAVPRRIFFFHAIKLQILSETIIYVVWYKKEKFLSVQVKNKPCDEGMGHAFILGSMVCMVANTDGVWPECHWGL